MTPPAGSHVKAVAPVPAVPPPPVVPEPPLPLTLVVPPPEPPLELMGEVVWYDPRKPRAGLRFKDASDEAKAVLERIVFGELVRGAMNKTPEPF